MKIFEDGYVEDIYPYHETIDDAEVLKLFYDFMRFARNIHTNELVLILQKQFEGMDINKNNGAIIKDSTIKRLLSKRICLCGIV